MWNSLGLHLAPLIVRIGLEPLSGYAYRAALAERNRVRHLGIREMVLVR